MPEISEFNQFLNSRQIDPESETAMLLAEAWTAAILRAVERLEGSPEADLCDLLPR
jgi:hypothetical protein